MLDLAPLIDTVVESHRGLIAGYGVRVVANPEQHAFLDPDRIHQVLGNLISNAAKYGEPGTEITIACIDRDDAVEIVVTNHGPGIPAEELPRLFSRFGRTRGAQAGRTPGLGLGLYIARGLVEAHGGRMWVESVPGERTSFHFTLPRVPAGRDLQAGTAPILLPELHAPIAADCRLPARIGVARVESMQLRRTLTLAVTSLTLVTLIACVALVLLTTLLRRKVDEMDRSQQAARIASDLAHHTLKYEFEGTATGRALSEAYGRVLLARADALVRAPEGRKELASLKPLLEQYWRAPVVAGGQPPVALIAELVRTEDLLAQRARARSDEAKHLDMISNVLGVAIAALLAAGVAFSLWWIRRFIFLPVQALAAAVDRFAHGDLAARAPVRGAEEVRRIAAAHNAMADALARTREDQLRYVATVVHDLRNPLAAVQLAIGYVTPDRPLPPERRIRDVFALIGRQLQRLNSLVGDVLNAVQIETGEIVLRRTVCDLGDLAQASVATFRTMAPYHRFEVACEGQTTLLGDAARLEQVLNNLIQQRGQVFASGERRSDCRDRRRGPALPVGCRRGPGHGARAGGRSLPSVQPGAERARRDCRRGSGALRVEADRRGPRRNAGGRSDERARHHASRPAAHGDDVGGRKSSPGGAAAGADSAGRGFMASIVLIDDDDDMRDTMADSAHARRARSPDGAERGRGTPGARRSVPAAGRDGHGDARARRLLDGLPDVRGEPGAREHPRHHRERLAGAPPDRRGGRHPLLSRQALHARRAHLDDSIARSPRLSPLRPPGLLG